MVLKEEKSNGRRIGFDYGDKRIGVATSDYSGILVSPHATIINDENLLLKLADIFNEIDPVFVVIGDPMHMSGMASEKSNSASNFALLIQSLYKGPIYLVDERLSTQAAYSTMRELGRYEKESKRVIDQIAAVNILESAMLNEKSGSVIGRRI